MFESLYLAYAREGLANERSAIELLRKYIDWVEGFELLGKELHLRSVSGKRVSIYELSDGHRVAAFMALLYAIARQPSTVLVDTPEAFVHPDGLTVVADFIASLAASGSQVIVATQSIEFLRGLLRRARERGVLDSTSVQRLAISRDGVARTVARWSGEASLSSIEELGADLRK